MNTYMIHFVVDTEYRHDKHVTVVNAENSEEAIKKLRKWFNANSESSDMIERISEPIEVNNADIIYTSYKLAQSQELNIMNDI